MQKLSTRLGTCTPREIALIESAEMVSTLASAGPAGPAGKRDNPSASVLAFPGIYFMLKL